MNYDFYGNAVEEYMRDYSESTTKTLKKANVDDEEIEYMIQKERQYIEKLLETNNKYAQLIMDLRLYRANETNNMISLTKYARRKNETNAIGIQSRQGSKGGTLAAESIAIDFIVWLYPEKRYEFNKLVYSRLLIIDNPYIWEDKNES